MSLVSDNLKHALLRLNLLQGSLERWHLLTYEDRIRLSMPHYRQPIEFEQEGNNRIGKMMGRNEPLMVTRLGAVELSCLRFFLEKRHVEKKRYSTHIRSAMANNAGFFPADDTSLDAFAEMFLGHLAQADVLAVWFNSYEDIICNTYCADARLIELRCLEPYRFTNPWSSNLAGRKVLVVHPFAESIRKQFTEKRHLLFASPDILPDFELRTIKAVQSIAGVPAGFATWFDAYRHMCDEIAKVDFDVCLIGAGAYGLPLASFAKQLGKQAIHMGGVTQLLFGIKGKRWEQKEYANTTAKMFNEHWIRPMMSETPVNKDAVEQGCYW